MSTPDPFEAVPEDLREALRTRGFERLTAVQSSVLDPSLRGRDLRISSQTGSGKTVALGLVLADELDGVRRREPAHRSRDAQRAARPRVLLIAPTRELAAQLAEELRWLYRPRGLQVAVLTGGTPFGPDFRALASDPEVLVGTPGRLLDHARRGSVDLSSVRAVALDEADEMLEMGFREELEGILEQVSAERRTHLVSATFPRPVLALADGHQRNAAIVQATPAARGHADIAQIAHAVRPSARVDALVNSLLADPDARTLVFVRTRAATAELATALDQLGFGVAALSGEMGQRERTRTLEAFRADRVRVLIATDVAARGLDIQGVARIVHFDLPDSAAAFTHRSGRTARAGAKGTSILLVPPAARGRVTALAKQAGASLDWQSVPGAAEIRRRAEERVVSAFVDRGEDRGLEDDPERERWERIAERLLKSCEARDLVAELLARTNAWGPCEPREIPELPRLPRARADRGAAQGREPARRDGDAAADGYARFQVSLGRSRGADPRILMALACRRGRVAGASIGSIRIGEHSSVVEVRDADAVRFERFASMPDSRDRTVRIRRWLPIEERSQNRRGRPTRARAQRDR